ncbi:glycoside hydrolase family 6 protein [Frigoribacterium sp. PhB24]|uniref:glycoside hydrolase family 6 protein n=1 Tax=Frigoribacterium sp. PhB24 TaxID=2485204 RepID=UPI000F46CD10|nr:glycoside hydrolase family 6 protein [Frigoribacterium sp. PhB24]ROS48965.1 endoglucanase [Frigoribacterium sp. PhB24]
MTHLTPTTRAAVVIGVAVALAAGLVVAPARADAVPVEPRSASATASPPTSATTASGPTVRPTKSAERAIAAFTSRGERGATGSPDPASSTVPTATTPAAAPQSIRTAPSTTLYRGGLYVDPSGEAARAANALSSQGRTAEAAAARTIAQQSVATWLGGWFTDAQLVKKIDGTVAAAEKVGATPVFVTYNIPNRDCGSHSAGGSADNAAYLRWNQLVASRLAGHRASVIVEPDALALISTCPTQTNGREATIAAAVAALADAGVPAYIDAGNSNWVPPQTMAARLEAAGVDRARGFATNVSNYYPVENERAYAEKVSQATGGARYVIDTSRNGRGWKGTWCNAPGAGLGSVPAVQAGTTKLDALLWIKTPGASDGQCNGGPAAGQWHASYAVQLVANRAVG